MRQCRPPLNGSADSHRKTVWPPQAKKPTPKGGPVSSTPYVSPTHESSRLCCRGVLLCLSPPGPTRRLHDRFRDLSATRKAWPAATAAQKPLTPVGRPASPNRMLQRALWAGAGRGATFDQIGSCDGIWRDRLTLRRQKISIKSISYQLRRGIWNSKLSEKNSKLTGNRQLCFSRKFACNQQLMEARVINS